MFVDSGTRKLIERYELAQQASSEGQWDWDLVTGLIDLSARFLSMVGVGKAAIYRPESWFECVHPDDKIWLFACLDGQREEPHGPFYIEHRVRTAGNGWRWLACRGVSMLGDDGTPCRLLGSICDINDTKRAEQLLSETQDRYAIAAAASSDGLYEWDLIAGKIDCSPRWKTIMGFSAQDITDSPQEWLGRVVPEDLIWLQATIDEQMATSDSPVPSFQIEYRIRDARDAIRWMACRGMVVRDDEGNAIRMIGYQADVTERKQAEQELRLSEERYALAARGAKDGLWDWRLETGESYFSPRCMSMLGYPEVALENRIRDWYKLVVVGDRCGLKNALRRHLRGNSEHMEHEFRMLRADGTLSWCLTRAMAVRDGDNQPVRIAGSLTDITARKKAELRLQYSAFHDGLTGLPNRALLLDRIGQAITRHRGGGNHPFAVALFDIDRFKSINDSLGTAIGDLVLTTTAARLLRICRTGDTLARLSADEFALLINDVTDPTAALIGAQRAGEVIARPFNFENRDVVLTASIGLALSITGYERAEDMLRDASLAMVRAKTAGRARVEVFDTRLRDHALAKAKTESELRRALDENQFVLHYQPIILLETGRIAGVEALIRWNHPERGMVPPVEFIPLAEESGLILPIGRWVLEESATQLVAWQAEIPGLADMFTCVNVSTQQLRDDDLLTLVQRVIEGTGIAPSSLKLEITESMLMFEQNDAEPKMLAIQELGVHFSIDDFGTGYSSFSYLHRVPADTLKIDKSFVQTIGSGPEKAAIVQMIATLGGILKMDVVAEGIETEEEASFLRGLRCKYGQGYLFSRPVPALQLAALLRREAAIPLNP